MTRKRMTAFAEANARKTMDTLPIINKAVSNGEVSLSQLIEQFSPVIEAIAEKVAKYPDAMDRESARVLLAVVDLIVGSVERHARHAGDKSGIAKQSLSAHLDSLLVELALAADIPAPRGSHYTYWMTLVDGQQMTHTGTAGEQLFGQAVRTLDSNQRMNATTLAPIAQGILPVSSKEATELMDQAKLREIAVRDAMLHLWKRDESGERNLPVVTFTVDMRTYLTPYSVFGIEYSGPNAANVAGQVAYDLTLGVYDDTYISGIVHGRMEHMDTTDRAMVAAALDVESSIFMKVMEMIPLTALELCSYSPQLTAQHLGSLGEHKLAALEAFVGLVVEGGKIWGSHQSQINTYLTNASREVPEELLQSLPVDPSEGVGGHSHQETEALMLMRARNGVVKALKAGLTAMKPGIDKAA